MFFKLLFLDNDKYFICLHKSADNNNIEIATINPSVMSNWISKKYNIDNNKIYEYLKFTINKFKNINNDYKRKVLIIIDLNKYLERLKNEKSNSNN